MKPIRERIEKVYIWVGILEFSIFEKWGNDFLQKKYFKHLEAKKSQRQFNDLENFLEGNCVFFWKKARVRQRDDDDAERAFSPANAARNRDSSGNSRTHRLINNSVDTSPALETESGAVED